MGEHLELKAVAGLLTCFRECSETDLAVGDERERGKVVNKAVPCDNALWS